MPEKHPNTRRHGGPGASHEDRSKPPPEKTDASDSTNPRVSEISGGGGERDLRHSHDDRYRSSKTEPGDLRGRKPGGVKH